MKGSELSDKDFLFPDTSWFDNEPDRYLALPSFQEFQRISRVDLRSLSSSEPTLLAESQRRLVNQSLILNEIQKEHGGFAFPFLVYTHCLDLFDPPPSHNVDADKFILGFDMTDSLRRRHIALSHFIIPTEIRRLQAEIGKPISIHNLGSGAGLDVVNAVCHLDGSINKVVNCDTNTKALTFGEQIATHLERTTRIRKGLLQYRCASLTQNLGKCHLVILIGIICGLPDRIATLVLRKAHRVLEPGGAIVVSSSNQNMRSSDPLASFLIQHIGSTDSLSKGWGLNFRTENDLRRILDRAGFRDIRIYDDANFPGRETAEDDLLRSIDKLPAIAMGKDASKDPLNLPAKEILARKIGFNWIAVATK
jgi:hypothetical protein